MKKLLILLIAVMLCGCAKEETPEAVDAAIIYNDIKLDRDALRLLFDYYVQQENAVCEPLYGKNFWNDIYSEGRTYAQYACENIFFNELLNLLALSDHYDKLADRADVNVSDEYVKRVCAAANITGSEDTVRAVLTIYEKAKAVRASCVPEDELSEEEYRVCSICEAVFNDAQSADKMYDRLKAGENFLILMLSAPEHISRTCSRADTDAKYADTVFSLKRGEYSDVYEKNGRFVITYMSEPMVQPLSDENRKEMIEELTRAAFMKICARENESASVIMDKEFYASLKPEYSDDRTLLEVMFVE